VTGVLQENGGVFTLTYGGVTATGGFQIARGADLTGRGSITGNVTNSGQMDVAGTNSTGTISITGNFTQTSTGVLNMEIGPAAGQYDLLAVSGQDTLDGTLNVAFIGGFVPQRGQVFSLLTYGSRSGTFATVSLPTYSGGHLAPRYDNPSGAFSLLAV
jgi:hypothetical protein